MYRYTCTVTCDACKKTHVLNLVSINPSKTQITQPRSLKGDGAKTELPCGHYQNLDGYPVKKKQ